MPDNTKAMSLYARALLVTEDIENYRRAFKLSSTSCSKSEPYGCLILSAIYERGLDLDRDFKKSFEYTEKGCSIGSIQLCVQLGWDYWNGRGTSINQDKALYYFQNGCNEGYGYGYNGVGVIYSSTSFEEKNYDLEKRLSNQPVIMKFYLHV